MSSVDLVSGLDSVLDGLFKLDIIIAQSPTPETTPMDPLIKSKVDCLLLRFAERVFR